MKSCNSLHYSVVVFSIIKMVDGKNYWQQSRKKDLEKNSYQNILKKVPFIFRAWQKLAEMVTILPAPNLLGRAQEKQ